MAVLRLLSPAILALSLLSPLALAAPAPHAIKARDYVTEIVTETLWVTEVVTVTLTVDELPASSVPAKITADATPTPVAQPEDDAAPAPVPEEAAPKPAPEDKQPDHAPPAPAPAPEAPAPAPEAPAPAPEAPAPAPEAPEDKEPDHAPPAPAPAPEAPAPSPEAPAPAPEAASLPKTPPITDGVKSSGGSETGDCHDPSSPCVGSIKHYEGGLSACGNEINTETDLVCALPFGFMGELSNSNPHCGKTITVENPVTGKIVVAKVFEKCMGCYDHNIDCTNLMFNTVTGGADGVMYGMKWYLSS